jgi:(S)-ureidoglycine aminohydrolase
MMKYKILLLTIIFLNATTSMSQSDTIAHGVYHWPASERGINTSRTVFKGTTRDFSQIEIRAHVLAGNNHKKYRVPGKEELLVIIISGTVQLHWNDSVKMLPAGSIALMMPGEKIKVSPGDSIPAQYYTMHYRGKLPVDLHRGDTAGGSFVVSWNTIPVKPTARGFRRDYFDRATALCRRIEMHMTTLQEGLASHDPHQHPHEEIILNLDNKTEMLIGDKKYKGGAGDFYYLTSGILHGIKNDGKGTCSYFAFRFE